MATETFPLAASALHPDWPQARFNISGMFTQHRLIFELLETMEQAFDCHLPIESVHGAPAVLWNAGRPSRAHFSPAAFKTMLQTLYSRNIGYFPTFSNHLLDSNDLNDPRCNEILDCISERPDLNGVIVTTDLLSNYIAKRHPSLRQIASIIRVTFDRGEGRADYYQSLGQRFYRYVVHPDDCRDLQLLDQLDRDKAEIIVNENCAIHCTNRVRHYEAHARWQKAYSSNQPAVGLDSMGFLAQQQLVEQEMTRVKAACLAPLDQACLVKRKRSCNLSDGEMKAVYDLGFRHFKLQGRGDAPVFYAYDLVRFMLDPHVVAPHVFKKLLHTICSGDESA